MMTMRTTGSLKVKALPGFEAAWDGLIREFDSLVYRCYEDTPDKSEREAEYVETSFRLVRHFTHPAAEMGIELMCDGIDAHITLFVLDPARNTDRNGPSVSVLGAFRISYPDLLEEYEATKQRALTFTSIDPENSTLRRMIS